ncbi:DUF4175 family protein [Maricaulis sp.]|uniref:DUF4175 domain-containing protein n=1 Tax=Maricaulis sp. TaxID=1486257 RepID=UPI001B042F8B|nr:DUF4175 family protein [Maricaulis sp.]MBO6796606.1 DUF4175 family protein [Maricaulis sp.]
MRRRTKLIAAIALCWERAAPVLWPTFAALSVFALMALLGVWETYGDPWRALSALALIAGAVWLTRPGIRGFAWPDEEDITRRIEEDSGISARPHEALIDQPSDDDPVALSVWKAHQERMARRLQSAFARRPKAAWGMLDPWALRGMLAVSLLSAWFIAGPTARDRLGEAFEPALMDVDAGEITLDAWIDPPAYTGRAPIFLDADETSADVPQGATFIARIAGSRRSPRVTQQTSEGRERAEVNELGDGVWEARVVMQENGSVRLISGSTRRSWTLDVLADTPPQVRILDIPEATADGELDLQFSVVDDYGATAYALELRPEGERDAEWDRLEITPSGIATIEAEGATRTLLETAQHALAGSRVDIRVLAEDAAGNVGRSPELATTLPERVFLDALARAVAEQRREVLLTTTAYAPLEDRPVMYREEIPPGPAYLAEEPERRIERAPESLQRVALALDAISDAPRYFFDDPIVYLGLREVLHRLRRARDRADLGTIEDDLWQIALRAELGSLADAEAALRAAERALAEALARGADETELAALFEAFEQAMENYMAALAREAVQAQNENEGGGGESLNNEALQALLDALRDAAELGNTADARQALAALSELLRNMEMQMGQGGGEGNQPDPVTEAIQEALEELGDMIGEQRDLQDQTFGMQQEQQQGGQPQSGQSGQGGEQSGDIPSGLAENQDGGAARSMELADMQSELAEQLQRSLQALPEGADQSAGDAASAMQQAEEALRQGDAQAALDAQEDALAELRAGAEQLASDLLERLAEQQGQDGQGEDGQEEDPLGRPAEGSFADGQGVEIPDELSRARAREILEELRRRAAEAGREQDELDYIERLLDRF